MCKTASVTKYCSNTRRGRELTPVSLTSLLMSVTSMFPTSNLLWPSWVGMFSSCDLKSYYIWMTTWSICFKSMSLLSARFQSFLDTLTNWKLPKLSSPSSPSWQCPSSLPPCSIDSKSRFLNVSQMFTLPPVCHSPHLDRALVTWIAQQFCWDRLYISPSWTWIFCISEDDLELLMLWTLPAKYWNYKCMPP